MDAEPDEVMLLDTSAAIALVVVDHEAHEVALDAVRGHRLGLAGHSWFETYSVLTRLPGALRRPPADVATLLGHNFPATAFLDPGVAASVGLEIARLGITGGAVYDALVGATARQHGRLLVSGDVRARGVYESLGVRHRLLG